MTAQRLLENDLIRPFIILKFLVDFCKWFGIPRLEAPHRIAHLSNFYLCAIGRSGQEDFRFSTPRERWKVDVRALQGVVVTNEPIQIPFPQRLRLAFPESDIETLIAAGQSKQSAVLRWLPRAVSVGLDAQLSRDWHEPEPD